MDESLEYTFSDGYELRIVLGEDGYNVNLSGIGYVPKMGTFTTFENMLYGIAPIIRGSEFRTDIQLLAIQLECCFTTDMDSKEIEGILMR